MTAQDSRRVYRRRDEGCIKSTHHWGQRKLLLAEMEFLSECEDESDLDTVVVYAGAAPGNHIPLLIRMFSNLIDVWELFDPRPFSWMSTQDNVFQHIDNLSDFNISMLKRKYATWKIILISDIRSADFSRLRYAIRQVCALFFVARRKMTMLFWLICTYRSRGSMH